MIEITYFPAPLEKNRICGHTFEAMDYHLLFYDNNIPSKIIIYDKIKPNILYSAYKEKYNMYNGFEKNIEFRPYKQNKKNYISTKNTVLIVSGFDETFEKTFEIYSPKIISFECGIYDYKKLLSKPNFYLLHDTRIHKQYFTKNEKHYIKKIYFNRYKSFNNQTNEGCLLYINNMLRDLNESKLIYFKNKYKNLFIVSGTKLSKIQELKYLKYTDKINYAPVKKFFNNFSSYIYTDNTRNFDCSSRLLVECKFYNKEIFIEMDYVDKGFNQRFYDLNDFDKLVLDKNDDIFDIIRG